eukprot:SAG31_NODE_18042_length_648_cov_4.540984_2_plen_73_part_01
MYQMVDWVDYCRMNTIVYHILQKLLGRPKSSSASELFGRNTCMLIAMPVVTDIFYNSNESKLLNNPKYFVVPT